MMTLYHTREELLTRLDNIAHAFSKREGALAIIGMGSVGLELDRLDRYSDIDFGAVVADGFKQQFIDSTEWLEAAQPIAYRFLNTPVGYKILYGDGILCEMFVIEMSDLAQAAYAPGRLVWKAEGVDPAIANPQRPLPAGDRPIDWLLGEALTNLFVGLMRNQRGETLTAMRFIQVYALDRLLELSAHIEVQDKTSHPDPFNPDRRYERLYPKTAANLPEMAQGYAGNVGSALAILTYLDRHFEINESIKALILALCGDAGGLDNLYT